MNKILINSNRIHGSALAKKIAESDSKITVDLIGAKIVGNLPKNLNYLGDDVEWNDRFTRLKNIVHNYDFIYAADIIFQSSNEFNDWREKISVPILCPKKPCDILELSKSFSKKILNKLKIPTPSYQILKMSEWGIYDEIEPKFFNAEKFVLKLDKTMICTGRQTMIANKTNYKKFIDWHYLSGHFNDYIVEEYIIGNELSCHFLCNGSEWIYLGSARDYKKEFEDDQGQNCSSTGCYTYKDILDLDLSKTVFSYAEKIIKYLNENELEFRGIIYLGLIIDKNGIPNILEINCRPGNPEFNAILETIDSKNLLDNLISASLGNGLLPLYFNDNKVVSVNILNKNYLHPFSAKTMPTLAMDKDYLITYFCEDSDQAKLLCNVLYKGKNLEECSKKILKYLETQPLNNFRFRSDIGILK